MDINKSLADAIIKSEIPISTISTISGISRTHIYNILNGEKNISSNTIEKICNAIGILPISLFIEDSIVRTENFVKNDNSLFSEILRKLRREKHLTQNQLATIINVTNGTIAMWETGRRQPDFNTLLKIANYFNVSIDYLLSGKKHQNYEENTIRIIGRNGVLKDYKVTEEQRKAFENLLSTITNDDLK